MYVISWTTILQFCFFLSGKNNILLMSAVSFILFFKHEKIKVLCSIRSVIFKCNIILSSLWEKRPEQYIVIKRFLNMLAHNLSNLLFTILQPPLQNRPKRECLIPVDMKKTRAVLHLWSIPYYTWGRYYICGQSLITLEVVITFVVNHLLHLRALLHLWSIITFVASTYINCG